jgi:hypothetical protein
MCLPERHKTLPTISLYVGVLLAMVSILSLSFLAFHLIADHVQKIEIDPTFNKFDELQLESARTALQHRGQPGLRDYLALSRARIGRGCFPHLRRTGRVCVLMDVGPSRIDRRTRSTGSLPKVSWALLISGHFSPITSS